MQFRLADIAAGMLLAGAVLSGIVSNAISLVCVLGALVCWGASIRLKDNYWLGLLAVIGWVGLAAFCSMLYQAK